MPKYRVLKPIGYSGRREVGEVLELTEEVAKAYGSEYLAPASEPEVEKKEATDEEATASTTAPEADDSSKKGRGRKANKSDE